MTEFHFLRPLWLLLLPFVFALAWWWRGQRVTHGGWSGFVDAHLLAAQFSFSGGQSTRWLRRTAPIAAVIALLAASGPTWEKENAQVMRQQSGRVFVLDLSQSMNASDLKPSRLIMARLKLVDLLQASRDRQVGLVVFAAEPYVVSPLTDDALTLRETASALTTALVPTQGSNLEAAIEYARKLLSQSGLPQGELVLITDSKPSDAAIAAAKRSAQADVSVSVLAVGTELGAPIPDRNGKAIRGNDGRPVIVGLPSAELKKLAAAGNGRFSLLQADSSDVAALIPFLDELGTQTEGEQDRTTEQWVDRGPWLLWLLLPWVLWVFSTRWF